jgi:hypothetical protein
MSKERELLKRVRDTLRGLKETYYDLYWDIQTALDQPESEPLSDEAILKIATKVCLEDMGIEMNPQDFKGTGVFELSRAIEKAHGIGGEE